MRFGGVCGVYCRAVGVSPVGSVPGDGEAFLAAGWVPRGVGARCAVRSLAGWSHVTFLVGCFAVTTSCVVGVVTPVNAVKLCLETSGVSGYGETLGTHMPPRTKRCVYGGFAVMRSLGNGSFVCFRWVKGGDGIDGGAPLATPGVVRYFLGLDGLCTSAGVVLWV